MKVIARNLVHTARESDIIDWNLNSVKIYGNIVSFRNLENETNEALELFGNKDAKGIVLLKPRNDYYEEYTRKVNELVDSYPIGEQIAGESQQKSCIVHETKSTAIDELLRPTDIAKIKCGKKHFAAIGIYDYASASPEDWRLR